MIIDRFYPIIPDINWLRRLLPLGIKTVQLRVKNESEDEIRRQIKAAIELTDMTDCQLIINDYWQLAIELGGAFIHLGQEDLARADLNAIKNAGLKLGLSSHDHTELETAIAAEPDYIALGPIYETKLKKMKWAPQGLDRIREWKSEIKSAIKLQIGCPLVAIGGLTVETAPDIFAAGADSLAVVTDIVTHDEPERRVMEWLDVTAEKRNIIKKGISTGL